jgi:hypothetical protein
MEWWKWVVKRMHFARIWLAVPSLNASVQTEGTTEIFWEGIFNQA